MEKKIASGYWMSLVVAVIVCSGWVSASIYKDYLGFPWIILDKTSFLIHWADYTIFTCGGPAIILYYYNSKLNGLHWIIKVSTYIIWAGVFLYEVGYFNYSKFWEFFPTAILFVMPLVLVNDFSSKDCKEDKNYKNMIDIFFIVVCIANVFMISVYAGKYKARNALSKGESSWPHVYITGENSDNSISNRLVHVDDHAYYVVVYENEVLDHMRIVQEDRITKIVPHVIFEMKKKKAVESVDLSTRKPE